MIKIHDILLVLAFIFTFISGCGKTEQQQQNQQQGDIKPTDQQQVQQPPAGEQTPNKIDSKNELGIKDGLPSDYPSDIPKPTNSKAMGYLSTQEGIVVTFESTDKPMDILKAFKADIEKNGFSKAEDEQMKEEGGMAMWKKDKREASIMLAWQKDKNITTAVVTYR